MQILLKKLIVVLPVAILTCFFIRARYHTDYRLAGFRGLAALGVSLLLFYAWIAWSTFRKRQPDALQMLVESSFYVYIFMVLTLTGYFILLREVLIHGWWHEILKRIARRDHVNFVAFNVFKIYKITDLQVVGNFVMLLPLGIYLPVMFKNLRNFFKVAAIALLFSCCIELLQLATSYRSCDIDDVILNTLGACVGYLFYKIGQAAINPQYSEG